MDDKLKDLQGREVKDNQVVNLVKQREYIGLIYLDIVSEQAKTQ